MNHAIETQQLHYRAIGCAGSSRSTSARCSVTLSKGQKGKRIEKEVGCPPPSCPVP